MFVFTDVNYMGMESRNDTPELNPNTDQTHTRLVLLYQSLRHVFLFTGDIGMESRNGAPSLVRVKSFRDEVFEEVHSDT